MSLLERQIEFRDAITADDDGAPPASTGMAIYRDAYRGRLLAALETSFERTRRWVGDDAFTAAAAHYILTHPPTGWSLDHFGASFPDVLSDLFALDAEVPELAWLEWNRSAAFAAPDSGVLDPQELASAGYRDAEWGQMRFDMAPGFAAHAISSNCDVLWTALAGENAEEVTPIEVTGTAILVWRRDLSPQHRPCTLDEMSALCQLADGAPFGEIAATIDVALLGSWLTQWLSEGIFSNCVVHPNPDQVSAGLGT